MALLELPPASPVDRTRAGVLEISVELIASLLRLPEGHETVAATVSPDGLRIQVLVEGALMPPVSERLAPESVQLLFHEQHDTGLRRVHCSFAHEPDTTWLYREDRLPAP